MSTETSEKGIETLTVRHRRAATVSSRLAAMLRWRPASWAAPATLRATRPEAFKKLVMVDANDAKAQALNAQNYFVATQNFAYSVDEARRAGSRPGLFHQRAARG